MQATQRTFFWNDNWWKNNSLNIILLHANNIRKNVQNDSSEFDGLLHKIVPKETFISQKKLYS